MMTTRTIEGILFGLLLTLLITGAAAEGVENVTTNGTTTAVPVVSPTAEVLWQALYGVDSNTSFLSLLPGREDGCILAGIARPSKDLVLAWTNRTGALLDQRRVPFGPGGGGNLAAVSSTADGGLLAVGSTRAAAPGDEDVALLRLGADGSIIWSRTYAIGANEIPGRKDECPNMMDMKNGWPRERGDDDPRWLHSDFLDVAFVYTYKVYEKVVENGGLK